MDLLRPLLAFLKQDEVWVDNAAFRLHYKCSVVLLLSAAFLVTSKQYFGDPISCHFDGVTEATPKETKRAMDTYCWIHSTFTLPSMQGVEGVDVPHPGVAPPGPGAEPKYHKYYQWVALVLLLQATAFYIPRYVWKYGEGGKIRTMVQGLTEPLLGMEEKRRQIGLFVRYFRLHRGTHGFYALRYFCCEILNLVNVLLQMFVLDLFLGRKFMKYGMDLVRYWHANRKENPMHTVFPKVTKCTFHKYGPSGTVENTDGLCVLPLNILNEKIFALVWFWLVLLALAAILCLLYRLVVVMSPGLRVALIGMRGGRSMKRTDVEEILEQSRLNGLEKMGDWFVLYLVCKNLDVLTVNAVVRQLHKSEKEESVAVSSQV